MLKYMAIDPGDSAQAALPVHGPHRDPTLAPWRLGIASPVEYTADHELSSKLRCETF